MIARTLLCVLVPVCCVAACEPSSASGPESPPGPLPGPREPSGPAQPATEQPPATTTEPPPVDVPDAGVKDPPDAAPPPCDLPTDKKGFLGSQSFRWLDETRTYELYVPEKYDGHTRFPVVFVFHGDGMTGDEIRSWISLEWEAHENAIFVYPNGPGKTWDTFTPPTTNIAYKLVDAFLDNVKQKLCVHPRRIFAWGISRGAFFVNHLGCFRGDTFRGIIANSGGGPSSTNPDDVGDQGIFKCPTPPVAAFVIHGDADLTVDFSAGDDSQRHWRAVNGCKETYTSINPSPCISYDGCKRPVIWCHLPGAGHKIWGPSMQATWDFISSLDP